MCPLEPGYVQSAFEDRAAASYIALLPRTTHTSDMYERVVAVNENVIDIGRSV